ncbi:hypothetical protein [Pontixanthobacter sp.]|uniref:hypothetical protein n=1 Tax=Pontixanthobacter sp. TaxID=2792078 RepID=UPI003C7BEA70
MMARIFVLALLPLLGACAATAVPPQSTQPGASSGSANRPSLPRSATPPPTMPAPSSGDFRAPRIMNVPGLEGVIGADSNALQQMFGTPRLNVAEGDARKLQFSGEACVLDIYLYPLREGAQPTATYVDARRASDGLDVDRASCVTALKR